jgi:hypothetical protein
MFERSLDVVQVSLGKEATAKKEDAEIFVAFAMGLIRGIRGFLLLVPGLLIIHHRPGHVAFGFKGSLESSNFGAQLVVLSLQLIGHFVPVGFQTLKRRKVLLDDLDEGDVERLQVLKAVLQLDYRIWGQRRGECSCETEKVAKEFLREGL